LNQSYIKMQIEDDVPLAEYARLVRRYIQDALTAPDTIDISHLKPGERHILRFGASMPGFVNAGGSTNTFLKRTKLYNDIDFFGPTEILTANLLIVFLTYTTGSKKIR